MENYELERQVNDLKRKVEDLEYDIRTTRQELESRIESLRHDLRQKADHYHSHD